MAAADPAARPGGSGPSPSPLERGLAVCGVVGVVGFVGAWAIAAQFVDGYSGVDDAISRLAAVDSPVRGWMTAGFVAFGVGVPLFAQALRTTLAGPAWIAATVTGLATLGVACTPLGRYDTAHFVFATIGYVSLAATPLLASRTLRDRGGRCGPLVGRLRARHGPAAHGVDDRHRSRPHPATWARHHRRVDRGGGARDQLGAVRPDLSRPCHAGSGRQEASWPNSWRHPMICTASTSPTSSVNATPSQLGSRPRATPRRRRPCGRCASRRARSRR